MDSLTVKARFRLSKPGYHPVMGRLGKVQLGQRAGGEFTRAGHDLQSRGGRTGS